MPISRRLGQIHVTDAGSMPELGKHVGPAGARRSFHLGTIVSGGEEKLFALAGYDGSAYLNTVEEWVEESSTWKAADNIAQKREDFGAATVKRKLVCPT